MAEDIWEGEKEEERNEKVEIKRREFLAVGEASKAIF